MELRGYRAEDFEALYALDVACFAEPFRFSRGMLRRSLEAKDAVVLVAEEEGIAGFVAVQVQRGGVGYVVTLDVAECWRRQGLAGELMRRVEAEALEAGCGVMALHVFQRNAAAIRFYERCGYERVGVAAGFYGDGVDAWVYRKGLGLVSSFEVPHSSR